MSTDPRLVRLKVAASMFGVGYDFLLAGVKEGDLPALQPQQAFLVEPDAVLAYIKHKSDEREAAAP